MSALGPLLRSHREAAGLTQEELAERAGLSARTISDVERGLRSRLYPHTAQQLASALGLQDAAHDRLLEMARGRPGTGTSSRLPEPLTPLVGRSNELAELVRVASPQGARLLTITGLGGMGKTRLAIAAAERLSGAYAGSVAFVEVAPNADADSLVSMLGAELGVTRGAGNDAMAMFVGDRPTLLVIDAFEHVLAAAREVEALLLAVPALHLLVTSRIRLDITGEQELALGPLESPDAQTLFLARAREADARLEDDPVAVAEICRRLSGYPLALELAAARSRHLPLGLLLARLDAGGTDVLAIDDGGRRSLAEAMTWTLTSLTAAEAAALRAAALFPGGCGLPVLERICGRDALSAVSGLVDLGLIVVDRSLAEARWRMLDVVREHVLDLHHAETERAVAMVLVRHYDELLVDLSARDSERDRFLLLAMEEANVRAALAWAGALGQGETQLRLAAGMWRYWMAVGALAEGRGWLEAGLGAVTNCAPDTRMSALWGLGWLAYHQADYATCSSAAHDLGALAAEQDDDTARRNAVTLSGILAIAEDRSADAVRDLEVALSLARHLDRPWILATSLLNLGLARTAAADFEGARDAIGDALRHYSEIDDERFEARSRGYLGLVSLATADLARARTLFAQSLQAFRLVGEPGGTAEGLAGLAAVAAAEGDAQRCAVLTSAAQRLRESIASSELPLERRILAGLVDQARESLGPEEWATVLSRGRSMSLEAAVDLALD